MAQQYPQYPSHHHVQQYQYPPVQQQQQYQNVNYPQQQYQQPQSHDPRYYQQPPQSMPPAQAPAGYQYQNGYVAQAEYPHYQQPQAQYAPPNMNIQNQRPYTPQPISAPSPKYPNVPLPPPIPSPKPPSPIPQPISSFQRRPLPMPGVASASNSPQIGRSPLPTPAPTPHPPRTKSYSVSTTPSYFASPNTQSHYNGTPPTSSPSLPPVSRGRPLPTPTPPTQVHGHAPHHSLSLDTPSVPSTSMRHSPSYMQASTGFMPAGPASPHDRSANVSTASASFVPYWRRTLPGPNQNAGSPAFTTPNYSNEGTIPSQPPSSSPAGYPDQNHSSAYPYSPPPSSSSSIPDVQHRDRSRSVPVARPLPQPHSPPLMGAGQQLPNIAALSMNASPNASPSIRSRALPTPGSSGVSSPPVPGPSSYSQPHSHPPYARSRSPFAGAPSPPSVPTSTSRPTSPAVKSPLATRSYTSTSPFPPTVSPLPAPAPIPYTASPSHSPILNSRSPSPNPSPQPSPQYGIRDLPERSRSLIDKNKARHRRSPATEDETLVRRSGGEDDFDGRDVLPNVNGRMGSATMREAQAQVQGFVPGHKGSQSVGVASPSAPSSYPARPRQQSVDVGINGNGNGRNGIPPNQGQWPTSVPPLPRVPGSTIVGSAARTDGSRSSSPPTTTRVVGSGLPSPGIFGAFNNVNVNPNHDSQPLPTPSSPRRSTFNDDSVPKTHTQTQIRSPSPTKPLPSVRSPPPPPVAMNTNGSSPLSMNARGGGRPLPTHSAGGGSVPMSSPLVGTNNGSGGGGAGVGGGMKRKPVPSAFASGSRSTSPTKIPKISFPANADSDSESDGIPQISVSGVNGGGGGGVLSISIGGGGGSEGGGGIPKINIPGMPDDDDEDDTFGVPKININVDEPSSSSSSQQPTYSHPHTHAHPSNPSPNANPSRSRLACGGCGGAIVGRIVSAMNKRWHPACFKCSECGEMLEYVSSYEGGGRAWCHFCYHERFAPKCYHCKTSIVDERFITLDDPELGKRTYHEQHFFCSECGDPFLTPSIPGGGSGGGGGGGLTFTGDGDFEDDNVGFTVYRGYPYCEACHVRLRSPKCKRCKKPIRAGAQAVEALGGKWCWECFVCAGCERPFDDPSFFVRENQPFCERCFSVMIKSEM